MDLLLSRNVSVNQWQSKAFTGEAGKGMPFTLNLLQYVLKYASGLIKEFKPGIFSVEKGGFQTCKQKYQFSKSPAVFGKPQSFAFVEILTCG